MKMISRRSFLKGAGVAAVTAAAAGCGATSSTASSEATSGASSEAGETGADNSAVLAEFDASAAALDDWSNVYDSLIHSIYQEADLAKRADMMHQAEDLLMGTHALMPIYYYVDTYMQKPYLTNVYNSAFGMKQFGYAENTNSSNATINICLASEPDYLDCRLSSSVDGGCMNNNLYSGLMGLAADGSAIPACAESYEVSEDGFTYTFKLQEGLKWSDGEPLDANDFVYSWNSTAAAETGASYSYLFAVIKTKEDGTLDIAASEDGLSLTVNLGAVCPYFLELAAFPCFFPVPQAHVEAANPDGTTPGAWALEAPFVTNGPYNITEWNHKSSIKLVKNPNFWGADNIICEELNFMLSDQDDVVFNAYNNGELDFIAIIPTDEIAALSGNPEYHIDPYVGTYYVSANVNSELFAGMSTQQACALRKGISICFDRGYICASIGQSGQVPANTFIPAGVADGSGKMFRENSDTYTYPDAENLGYYNPTLLDYDSAMQYFAAAGLTVADNMVDGFGFNYLVNAGSGNEAIGAAIQQDMAVIGITVTIEVREWAVFLEERKTGKFDIARNGWIMDYNDPVNMLEMWLTDSGNNDCQFGK